MCFFAKQSSGKNRVWPGAVTPSAFFLSQCGCPRHVVMNAADPRGAVVVLSNLCVWITFVSVCVCVFVQGGWWDASIHDWMWLNRTLLVTAVWALNKKLPSFLSTCPAPFLYMQCHICSTGVARPFSCHNAVQQRILLGLGDWCIYLSLHLNQRY